MNEIFNEHDYWSIKTVIEESYFRQIRALKQLWGDRPFPTREKLELPKDKK